MGLRKENRPLAQIRGSAATALHAAPAADGVGGSSCEGVDLYHQNAATGLDGPAHGRNGTYGGFTFAQAAVAAVEARGASARAAAGMAGGDAGAAPLFLFYAYQVRGISVEGVGGFEGCKYSTSCQAIRTF